MVNARSEGDCVRSYSVAADWIGLGPVPASSNSPFHPPGTRRPSGSRFPQLLFQFFLQPAPALFRFGQRSGDRFHFIVQPERLGGIGRFQELL